MLPDAWFCPATPLRPLRRRGSSPAEGSSFSSTPRPPPLGWPSSSFLPSLGGESFLVPPPRFHERRAPRTRQMTSPTPPCCGKFSSPGGFLLLGLLLRHHIRC